MQSTFIPAYEEAWSEPLGKTSRVFLIKHHVGGTRMDHGVVVGFGPDRPERFLHSPYIIHLLAHEFFHEWLGGKLLREDASLVWFGEGFTDYLSLYYCVKTRMVSQSWFVERIVELAEEAIHNSSLGQVSFADTAISWLDGNGPNETMAYKGGALLAFSMDSELRKLGKPGLMDFLKSLYRDTGHLYSLADIREQLLQVGMNEFYERHILGKQIPDLVKAFAVAGIPMVPVDCQLTYFGIRTEGHKGRQTVAEIDPNGPAARVGVLVGDLIVGHSGQVRRGVAVKESVKTPFNFGLFSLDPEEVPCKLRLERAGKLVEITLTPALIDGGILNSFEYESGRMDGFFGL
jgi:predicted metalloprotease with PDZ domain